MSKKRYFEGEDFVFHLCIAAGTIKIDGTEYQKVEANAIMIGQTESLDFYRSPSSLARRRSKYENMRAIPDYTMTREEIESVRWIKDTNIWVFHRGDQYLSIEVLMRESYRRFIDEINQDYSEEDFASEGFVTFNHHG